MSDVDEVLAAVAEPEQLSFYGMHHWLGEISAILEKIDDCLLSKKRSPLEERKEEIVEAQKRLRNSMGAIVKNLSLTKRERPLAEVFLKQQLTKIEKAPKQSGAAAEKATAAIEKLRQLLEDVGKSKAAPETKEVQDIEESIKTAEAEWKEVSPIYEKWEKGKHSFKTNDELQKMKRRYTECKKVRETGEERLLKALCSSREGKAVARPQEPALPKGWSAVAKKAPSAATSRAKVAPKRATAPSAWGSAAISFAQRLRAQASAQIREEARTGQEAEEGNDSEGDYDGEDKGEAAPEAARPPVKPKAPPPLPASADGFTPVKASGAARPQPRAAPKAAPTSDDEEEENEEENTKGKKPTGYNASAKKKGKSKKKKGGDRDDFDVPEPIGPPTTDEPSTSIWTSTIQPTIEGSVLKELLRPQSWSLPEDSGDERLQSLTERLDLVNPLGLTLAMEWKQFLSLEVDGGPPRTSRRGTAPWITRVGKNVPIFLAHYITIIFVFTFLQELSFFGLPMWALILQVALILAPPIASLQSPQRVLFLQAAHLLLWFLFMRSLWQMHFFIKVFCVLLVGCHAYVVAPVGED